MDWDEMREEWLMIIAMEREYSGSVICDSEELAEVA